MRVEDRERIQVEVVSRVVERQVHNARSATDGYLEMLINDTLYHERKRLEREDRGKHKSDWSFYDNVLKKMNHSSERDLQTLLEMICRRFVEEVVGKFDPRVYGFATRAVPAGLWGLLNAMSPKRLFAFNGVRKGLADHLRIEGEVDHLRKLKDRGTLVVVPTHSSNLDSIVLGYANYLMGLPPLTYGAGLNLFTNPLISFFMRNLGAYRVDRKKSSILYKDVLKEYATCSMEMGYHNLFFPGGTRSRSGSIEQKIKKGLLGASLRAYIGNLRAGRPKPNLYIVPWTVNYLLVLEAETLIDDYLKEAGKSRYIIEDDEFSKPRLIFNFFSKLVSLDSRILIRVAKPLDVFGNQVDEEGRSIDARGRSIDTTKYVTLNGAYEYDDQRDAQYTGELSLAISKSFLNNNVILSTHLVAFCLFELLKRYNPKLDLYRLLHTGGGFPSFPMQDVHQEVSRILDALKQLPHGPRLDPLLQGNDIQEIVVDALRAFSIFHSRPAAIRRGDRLFHEDRNLLYYYSNRLKGYNLDRYIGGGQEA